MSAKDDGSEDEPKRRRAPASKRARSKAGKTTRTRSSKSRRSKKADEAPTKQDVPSPLSTGRGQRARRRGKAQAAQAAAEPATEAAAAPGTQAVTQLAEPATQPAVPALPGLAWAAVAVAARDAGEEAALRGVLAALGVAAIVDPATAADADVALIAVPERADVAAALRRELGARPVVVACLDDAGDLDPDAAELFAVRPLSAASLAPVLHAALVLRERDQVIAALQDGDERLRARRPSGAEHFDFFERVLVMEIKRARRFGYSLAVALVAPDAASDPERRDALARAIAACIRDIDLPIDYADGRVLIVLPYTDHDGARLVGERVAAAAQRASGSVSVGIAALRPGKPVSFARLLREATAALKAAQLKGGGRVVVRP